MLYKFHEWLFQHGRYPDLQALVLLVDITLDGALPADKSSLALDLCTDEQHHCTQGHRSLLIKITANPYGVFALSQESLH